MNPNVPDTGYAGSVSGRVTRPGGGGLANVFVGFSDLANMGVGGTVTDSTGNYTIALPAGSYKVNFNPMNAGPCLFEWYNNTDNINLATPVTVTSGQTTTGIDAQLKVIKRR